MNASTPSNANTNTLPDLPALLDQLRSAAAQAPQHRKSFRIQGSGSHDFYGESLEGELLETRGLSGIVQYEPSELVITVGAGTSLLTLEKTLAAQGQCLAFEPPVFSVVRANSMATVGGMVAAGLSGPARASVGSVRDFVLGLKFINGKGEHLTFGGQVMKNVAGYDVSRLLAGSWGTLGLITEVSLKVLPIAPAEAFLSCHLPQEQALTLLHRWGGQPLPLNASCWVKDTSLPNAPEILFVRLRGAQAAVEAAKVRMSQDVAALNSTLIEQAHASASQDWLDCADQRLPFFTQAAGSPELALWRLSVPQTAPVLNLPDTVSSPLIEWQGGQRWVWAPLSAAEALRREVAAVGGQATLFKRPRQDSAATKVSVPVFTQLDPVQQRIQQALKNEFDPAGLFGPRRLNVHF